MCAQTCACAAFRKRPLPVALCSEDGDVLKPLHKRRFAACDAQAALKRLRVHRFANRRVEARFDANGFGAETNLCVVDSDR